MRGMTDAASRDPREEGGKLRLLARATLVGLIGFAVAVGTSIPAMANTDISHVEWFDVSKDHVVFLDSHVVHVTGVHEDGGCRFHVNLKRKLSEPTVGALELGRDSVSCVDVVREGHVNVTASQEAMPSNTHGTTPTSAGGDPCANEDFQWRDPINLRVTEVTTYGCFLYTGQYVGNCTTSQPSVWWNTPSGWHNLGPGDNTVTYNGDDTQCYASTNNNFVHYAGTGCWSGTTYAYYQWNQLVMYGNGAVGSGTNSWVSGACTGQLHSWSNL